MELRHLRYFAEDWALAPSRYAAGGQGYNGRSV
jgi:hypothetical protein